MPTPGIWKPTSVLAALHLPLREGRRDGQEATGYQSGADDRSHGASLMDVKPSQSARGQTGVKCAKGVNRSGQLLRLFAEVLPNIDRGNASPEPRDRDRFDRTLRRHQVPNVCYTKCYFVSSILGFLSVWVETEIAVFSDPRIPILPHKLDIPDNPYYLRAKGYGDDHGTDCPEIG
jgi:hypothetical protein